ncbi:uncharacterized protein LOC132197151 [Neocloeon triangulifer]|uniref:uncharacterized protein LOC132197151 n=1 Tax=Neocloeon triangulifer TaxID=2078957 RepID=UPI00286ECF0E|nr:uncharacterized protein LOC132197151 [Neocloeon triangulifer]
MSDVYMSAAFEGNSYVGEAIDASTYGEEEEDEDDPLAPKKADAAADEEDVNLEESSEEESVECPFCDRTFSTTEDLERHVGYEHKRACLRCRRTLATDDEYETHLQQHEDSYTCHLCDQQFGDEADFEFHRMDEHSAKKCPRCLNVLLDHEFRQHTKMCHLRKQVLRPLKEDSGVLVVVPAKRTRRGGVVGKRRSTSQVAVRSNSISTTEVARRVQKGAAERSRRAELGQSFDHLRIQIPLLRHEKSTATKQAILAEAISHIKVLEEQSHTYHKVRLLLTRQQQRLRQRVKELDSTSD